MADHWRKLIGLFILVVMVSFSQSPVGANHLNNFYTGLCSVPGPCRADNYTHTVATVFLVNPMHNQTKDTLDDRYEPLTDLNIVYHASNQIKWSGSAETDVIYWLSSGPPVAGFAGIAICDDANVSCDQFYVYYNTTQVAAFSTDYSYLEKLACHETGHTTGLVHGGEASPSISNTHSQLRCMKTGYTNSDKVPGPHNIWEIDNGNI